MNSRIGPIFLHEAHPQVVVFPWRISLLLSAIPIANSWRAYRCIRSFTWIISFRIKITLYDTEILDEALAIIPTLHNLQDLDHLRPWTTSQQTENHSKNPNWHFFLGFRVSCCWEVKGQWDFQPLKISPLCGCVIGGGWCVLFCFLLAAAWGAPHDRFLDQREPLWSAYLNCSSFLESFLDSALLTVSVTLDVGCTSKTPANRCLPHLDYSLQAPLQ